MFGGQPYLLDPDLRPRRGQKVTLDYLGREIEGRVTTASATSLEIRPESVSFLRHARPSAHVRVVIIARAAICEVVLTNLHVRDDVISGQIVGHPVSIQRRADERVDATLAASLTWLNPFTGGQVVMTGRTQNLSVGGALLRLSESPHPLPCQDSAALLGLQLPGTDLVSLSVRVLQAWNDGARVQVVDASPVVADRLGSFVRAELARIHPSR